MIKTPLLYLLLILTKTKNLFKLTPPKPPLLPSPNHPCRTAPRMNPSPNKTLPLTIIDRHQSTYTLTNNQQIVDCDDDDYGFLATLCYIIYIRIKGNNFHNINLQKSRIK